MRGHRSRLRELLAVPRAGGAPRGGAGGARRGARQVTEAPVPGGRRDEVERTRRHLAALAWLLDSAFPIPGTNRTFGIGPVLGLVPLVGDLVGAAAGGYLILRAMRFGLPKVVIVRMVVNVLVDAAVGVIPLAGDAFDVVFKPNERNLRLFEQHALEPGRSTRSSWGFLGAILAVVVVAVVLLVLLAVAVLQAIVDLLQGAPAG